MKEIPLTQGKVALVDDADFDWLNQWKWFVHITKHNFYARRYSGGGRKATKKQYMHRLILNPMANEEVDHKDKNGLNNQRNNLRKSTHSQNNSNKSKTCNKTTSKYISVSWFKPYKMWRAYVANNKKVYHVGYFDNEIEAAKARDIKTKQLHGEFASLNFK